MIAGTRAVDPRRASRPLLFAAIVAAHLLALWLLLRPTPAAVAAAERTLALFDVALPPPAQPPPPPPPPARRASADGARATSDGGSPGVSRERAAVRVDAPAPPMREAMDATATALPLAPPPALPAGTAMLDLGAGGAGGLGTGAGAGTGSGDGNGSGGGEDVFGRADWVKRPPDDAFRRNWPLGRPRLGTGVVVVLACLVRRSGVPYRCRLRSETPRRWGFARTALMVMPEARVRPVARNGAPLWDMPVVITVVFNAIEVAPRVPVSAAASAPRAR